MEATDDVLATPVLIKSAVAPPQPAPPLSKSEAELIAQMNRVNAIPPPTHYLRGPAEPWRPYISWFL
jgi:hypothetical protein